MYEHYDTYNSHLTNFAQGMYLYPEEELDLTRKFFPVVPVETTDGTFDRYTRTPALTPVSTALPRDNSPRRIQPDKVLGSWHCRPNAIEVATFGPALLQKGNAKQLRESHVRTLMSAQFSSRQKAAADAITAAVMDESTLGAWAADTDIILQIDELCRKVVSQSGKRPNSLGIGIDAWALLRNHAAVLDRQTGLSYGITPEHLKDMLLYKGIEIYLIDSFVEVNNEITPLLNDQIIALYNAETPSLEDMSFGKEFTLCPSGPEVLSYKEHGGVNEVDVLMWSSDCQVTNPAACARMTVAAAA